MQLTVNTRDTLARALRPLRARLGALKIRWYLFQLEREERPAPRPVIALDGDPDAAAAEMQRTGAAYVADADGRALMC